MLLEAKICSKADNTNQVKNSIVPELQFGNVEYKLKIINPSKQRFEHLVTQMNWRIREGNGTAVYKIGVEDNGTLSGISPEDMKTTLQTLTEMADALGATIVVTKKEIVDELKMTAEVSVRKVCDDQNVGETRVAVLGNVDAGKSTLLGVLTQGILDNGRGSARLNMFRHQHEIKSGRTSSFSYEILGFDSQGRPINYSSNEFMTPQEISSVSSKLIKFLDLGGHKKYFRTTVQGFSSFAPHLVLLVVSGTAGTIGMAQEHLSLIVALNLKFFIVITKTDLSNPLNATKGLKEFLSGAGCSKAPLFVDDSTLVDSAGIEENVVPVFCVSSVTGEGLKLLFKYLYAFSIGAETGAETGKDKLAEGSAEFQIYNHFVYNGSEKIVCGLSTKGLIKENSIMKIGPLKDGTFKHVGIKSIHRNRVPCRVIYPGQTAAICLNSGTVSSFRKGMILTSLDAKPSCCWYFEAKIDVLMHPNSVASGFQTMVHVGCISQTASVIKVLPHKDVFQRASKRVLFKFQNYPECIRQGQRLIFRTNVFKGTGEVVKTLPLSFQA